MRGDADVSGFCDDVTKSCDDVTWFWGDVTWFCGAAIERSGERDGDIREGVGSRSGVLVLIILGK